MKDFFNVKEVREVKSSVLNVRIKPSVKSKIDVLCHRLGYSHADLIEAMVLLAEREVNEHLVETQSDKHC